VLLGRETGAVMNDSVWWARVVQARTKRSDLVPQRVWTLHKGEHAAAIYLKAGARRRRGDRAHGRRGAAQDAAVPVARTGGTVGAIAACDDVRG
jgi:hypothetical protein